MTETETDKDDLVVRLRSGGMVRTDGGYSIPREKETMREAADEIERLRTQLAKARKALKEIESFPYIGAKAESQMVLIARAALADDIGNSESAND